MAGPYNITIDEQLKNQLCFVAKVDNVPEDDQRLKAQIEFVNDALIKIFPKQDPKFKNWLVELLALARIGLSDQQPDKKEAIHALGILKEKVLNSEAGRVKNTYLKTLGKFALINSGVLSLLYIVFSLLDLVTMGYSFLFLLGSQVGCWLSFGITKQDFAFEDLTCPEKDRLEPPIRLIFIGLLSAVLGLLFFTDAFQMEVGNLSTESFLTSPSHALLIGTICGIGDKVLPKTVESKLSQFFKQGE